MCYQIRCTKCNKFTWAGCGMHKDAIMRAIPVEQCCTCGSMKSKPQSQNYQQVSFQSRYFDKPSGFPYK